MGEEKKDAGAGPQPIVLKVDLHCQGCANKVRKAIKRAPGVESVTPDIAAGKVVMTGTADAVELKERIESRVKKLVQIISVGASPPKNEKEKEKDKKVDNKGTRKKVDKDMCGEKTKEEKKKPNEEMVTLKIRLLCNDCNDRIRHRIYKIKGVKDVAFDVAKDLAKVTGTMDATAIPAYLREKPGQHIEVIAPGIKDVPFNKGQFSMNETVEK